MLIDNAKIAADDIVKLRIESTIKNLETQTNENRKLHSQRTDRWTDEQLNALSQKEELLSLRLDEQQELLQKQSKKSTVYVEKMVKRTQQQLLEANRIKRRKAGGGRPAILDDEVENFIVKCIEEKSLTHGRRKDTTVYTGRHVKVGDLKDLANYILKDSGKQIRSPVTAWNLSKPRNKRSIQAKRHRGSALFCTRKPYKADENHNENTHHRRAFKKYVKRKFFSQKSGEEKNTIL